MFIVRGLSGKMIVINVGVVVMRENAA